MIGAVLYFSADITQDTTCIDRILSSINRSGVVSLDRFRTSAEASDTRGRHKLWNNASSQQLMAQLGAGLARAVYFDDGERGREPETELDIFPVRSPATSTWVCPFEASILCALDDAQPMRDAFVAAVLRCAEIVDASYGIIVRANEYETLRTELDSIPSRIFGVRQSADQEALNAWLGFWQRHRADIGRVVRTACFGNIIGRHLLEQLGGRDEVLERAPAARTEAIGNGSVYLESRVGSPIAGDTESVLSQYLAPIAMHNVFRADAPLRRGPV